MKRRSSPSLLTSASATELLFQQLVEARRISLSLGGLHRLSDEEPEKLVLAGAILRKLRRVGCYHGINRRFDRGFIGDLAPAARLDDRIGFLAFVPHRLEDVLGHLPRDGVVGNSRQ